MKKQKHPGKNELILIARQNKANLETAWRAVMLIALVVLHEEFKYGPDRLNRFVDRFKDTLDYYNESDDYQKLLDEWNEYFYDYAGLKIIKP